VGVFLSGGLDSSTIAALAQMQTSHPLKTFSLAFDDPAFDESTYSRQVAKFLGTEHFEETLTEQTVLNTLEAALDCLDEPLADPSLLPTFLLSKLASQHVKVVLGGDGGDELFAGYPTYLAHQYAQAYRQIPEWLRSRIISNFVRKLPTKNTYQSLEWKIKRFIFRWDNNPVVRHFRWMSNTDLQDLSEIITASPSIINNIDDFTSLQLQEPSNHMLALDFLTYLPGSVLTKVDRASMAHGLEVRPPFLDSEVVELAFLTPLQIKLRKGKEKYLLKMAAQNYLPKEIILRKKKGFAIPLARWLKGPLRQKIEETLIYSPLWKSQTLNQHTFIKWNKEHQIGAIDRSRSLWALLVLDHWIRKNNILERS
jgi:asparagine synthase (glutamine-hydrolysing)